MTVVFLRCVLLVCTLCLTTSLAGLTGRSFSWSQSNQTISKRWTKMAADASGQYMAVIDHEADNGHIYVSDNYGLNWTKAPGGEAHYSSISSSNSGTLLTATVSGGGIAYSKDHGVTWQTHAKAPVNYWTAVASDDSGVHLAAVVHLGGIYTSQDSGDTWNQTPAPSTDIGWISISSDSTGEYLVAVSSTGEIYNSQDRGQTWSKSQTKKPKLYWSGVATDASGKFVAAVSTTKGDAMTVLENGLHYSSDYGKTFTLKYHMARLAGVTMDSTGTMIATILTDSCNNMYIAQSFDSGGNFETASIGAGQWTHVMMNGKGDRIIATRSDGLISTAVLTKK